MSAHNPHAGQGPVVVDVGGDVGALVLRTDARLAGAEIEISPLDRPGERSHVAVLSRGAGPHGEVFAAVYPALREGSYVLWQPDGAPTAPVHVRGGAVTDVRWSELAPRQGPPSPEGGPAARAAGVP